MSGIQEQHEVAGHVYIHKDDHRNRSPAKSQWTISKDTERDVFAVALSSSWKDNELTAWGIRRNGADVEQVGMGIQRTRTLYIAKFVGTEEPPIWHGYPADHQVNNADIPGDSVLRVWLEHNVLPKSAVSKIAKGKSWSP